MNYCEKNKQEFIDHGIVGECPFCGGPVTYSKMDKATRSPDTIQCIGDCFFEIQTNYEEGEGAALKYYSNLFENWTKILL
jgi:hypothetical protein